MSPKQWEVREYNTLQQFESLFHPNRSIAEWDKGIPISTVRSGWGDRNFTVQHDSCSKPPPMVLKLGKSIGESMVPNLVSLVSGNPSNTERVLGDSIQRSWQMESQSTFMHSHCAKPSTLSKDERTWYIAQYLLVADVRTFFWRKTSYIWVNGE
jgi:hypothetical protein